MKVWSGFFSSEQGKVAKCYKGAYKMSRSIRGGKFFSKVSD